MKYKLIFLLIVSSIFLGFYSPNTSFSSSQTDLGDKLPLFYDDFCTKPGDNRCFEDYIKEAIYAIPNRCEENLKGKVNMMFTVSEKGWITKAEYKGGDTEICEYYKEKLVKIFLDSPKWIPAQKDHENVSHTTMILLQFK